MLTTRVRLTLLTLCLAGGGAVAQEKAKPGRMMSAFEAVGLLAPEEQAALARIVARDGTPNPERWHLLIYAPAAEAGLREFTVADGKITGSHTVSQFAERIGPAEVFPPSSLHFDSVHVARIAQEYCRTNGVIAATMHYDLRKGGPEAIPLWTVVCVNAQGEELGQIVVQAGLGTVIYHPGFAAEPLPAQLIDRTRPVPLANSTVPAVPTDNPPTRPDSATAPAPRRAKPTPAGPTPKPNFFQRVFGGAQR